MKKSGSAGSSRAGSGGSRSKPSSACSGNGDVRSKPSSATSASSSTSTSARSKPSSANSESGTRVGRPSDKLNPKTCDPFNEKKISSAFVSVYTNGGIPCRLMHGSVKHKLGWSIPIETVSYDPVLVTLADGLKETVHPYAFVARQGFVELLDIPNSNTKVIPVLSKLIGPIRNALAHSDVKVFEAGLDALMALSNAASHHLNQYIKQFMVPLSKRLSETNVRDLVNRALQTLETNGGKEASTVIKSKIPTYNSVIVGPG